MNNGAPPIVMDGDDFKKVVLGLNVLSNLMFNMTGAEEIRDLDGDIDTGWFERWSKVLTDAHDAVLRARYAKGETS